MDKNYKALNENIDCGTLSIHHISNMREEFFVTKDYEWWGKVQPGDIVVDIGACVGMFSCLALDEGASKVYMVEPNKELLKLAMKNTQEYVINKPTSPVVPIHGAIVSNESHLKHIYNSNQAGDYKRFTFRQLLDTYNIDKIDYLKIDCEGGEYDIFTTENIEWIDKNVKHIAVEMHLRHYENGGWDFIKFRNEFLKHFIDKGTVRFMSTLLHNRIYNDAAILNKNYDVFPPEFMLYIINGQTE